MGYDAFTWSKIAALGAMFFCILFNYTILRDTKVRGEGAGAEKGCFSAVPRLHGQPPFMPGASLVIAVSWNGRLVGG
jgi:hypothetical protein